MGKSRFYVRFAVTAALTAVLGGFPGSSAAQPKNEEHDEATRGDDEQDSDEASFGDVDVFETGPNEEVESVAVDAPPAVGTGAVWGEVRDTKFNEPLVEARVEAVGQKAVFYTDENGRFRLDLPPGEYTLRVSYELHRPERAENVRVVAGRALRVDFKLVPDESAVEEFVIEGQADRASIEGQNLERRRSAAVGDIVGRRDIARTPDRNAAEAARRVVGATIVGGRFVYVRGLGERYTNAELNGAPLPSPEPDRQTVALDLFPALALDSLTIVKQFTPDVPGDFAGGSVRIVTRSFPRERVLELSLSGTYDTATTFRAGLSAPGSGTDFLGFDTGLRQLPDGLPDIKLDSGGSDDETRFFWGRQINSFMSARPTRFGPDYSMSFVYGDATKLNPDTKLGAIGALSYGRSFERRGLVLKNYLPATAPGGPIGARVGDDFRGQEGYDRVRWGAFGNVSVELSRKHELALTLLHSQAADDLASELEGTTEASPGTRRTIHLEYTSRALSYGQLRGSHQFAGPLGLELDWFASLARAARDQPDTRDTEYSRIEATPDQEASYVWAASPTSGLHFYSDQSEITRSAGLDFTHPLTASKSSPPKLKLGGLLSLRGRDFSARRFVFEPVRATAAEFIDATRCPGGDWDPSCPNRVFRAENINEGGIILRESTLRFDEYEASTNVYAVYAMLDVEVLPSLRAVGGARLEVTDQNFLGWDPFDRENTELGADLDSVDVLPALSLVYALTKKHNTRFGLSKTLARPQLREIAPFLSNSFTGRFPEQGNPDLELTNILNADLRFEYFPTPREVAAFSFFYKHFEKPIEQVLLPGTQSGLLTFANAEDASLIGVELEGRKGLGFLNEALAPFTFIGNVTFAHSRVNLGDRAGIATNPSRALAQQSPYIVNLSLDYESAAGTDVRVLYNVFGPRITAVGSNGVPDVFELPRHTVDATVAQRIDRFELKLTLQNLLGTDVVFAHHGARELVAETQPDGTIAFVPGREDPETLRYDPGTSFTFTASYKP